MDAITEPSETSVHTNSKLNDCVYTPLREDQIRLLDLSDQGYSRPANYRLATFALQQLPRFIAISYRWHEHLQCSSIIINDVEVEVKSNVADCLQNLSKHWNWQYIWIDSICIDQADVEERSAQVGLMGIIYSTADSVFAWLGLATFELSAALDAVESIDFEAVKIPHPLHGEPLRLDDHQSFGLSQVETTWKASNGLPPPNELERLCRALLSLARLDYWDRTWIVQEISLARIVFLVVGSRCVPLTKLRTALDSLFTMSDQDSGRLKTGGIDTGKLQSWYENNCLHVAIQQLLEPNVSETKTKKHPERPGVTELRNASGSMRRLLYSNEAQPRSSDLDSQKLHFLSVLDTYRNTKCSDIRDKIYGLLSIADPRSVTGLKANYSRSVEELLITVLAAVHSDRIGYQGNARAMNDGETLQSLLRTHACDPSFLQWIFSRCNTQDSLSVTEFRYSDGLMVRMPIFQEWFEEEPSIRGICDLGTFAHNTEATIEQLEHGVGARATAEVHKHFQVIATNEALWKYFLIDDPLTTPIEEIHGGKKEPSRLPKLFLDMKGAIGIACPSARMYDRIYKSYCYFRQPPIRIVVREIAGSFQIIGRAFHCRRKVILQPLPEKPPELVREWQGDTGLFELSLISILALSSPMPEEDDDLDGGDNHFGESG